MNDIGKLSYVPILSSNLVGEWSDQESPHELHKLRELSLPLCSWAYEYSLAKQDSTLALVVGYPMKIVFPPYVKLSHEVGGHPLKRSNSIFIEH